MSPEPPPEASPRLARVLGALLVTLGGAVALVAVGALPLPPESVHAPPAVLGLTAAFLASMGGAVWAAELPRTRYVLGAVTVGSFAAVLGWIALWGPAEAFDGHVISARVLFGVGSALCALLLAHGLRRGP